MSFTVEYSDDGGATFQTIQYGSFDVEYGLSDVLLAPLAAVDASRQAGASTGDRLRIQENGSDIFTGRLTTGGEVRSDGQTRLQAEHDIYSVFADSVSITVSNPTDEDVYNAALSAANGGSGYTLNYVGTATSLADDYDVDDRKVKRIFKDMTDRTDRVFYVGVGDTITVAPRRNGGQFADLNAGDGFRVEKYNPGDIDTVRNAVTVNGTGGEQVSATETDSTSIGDFGRRAKVYNFSYIRSAGEASSMASELLIPDPLADAELLLGRSISNTTDVQVNTTIDFDDPDGSGASDVLTVEKQTISPGATTVRLGEGAGVSIANVRRDNQSRDDLTTPGTVYDTDRIAELAITETEIDDDSISTPKLKANAVTANVVDTLDLDTNQLTVGSDTNSLIEFQVINNNDTIQIVPGGTTNDARIGSSTNPFLLSYFQNLNCNGTVFVESDTGIEVDPPSSSGQVDIDNQGGDATVSAEFVDTDGFATETAEIGNDADDQIVSVNFAGGETGLQPETDGTCQLGSSGDEYSSVWAKDFYSEGSVVATDGADPLAGLAESVKPPEHCLQCDGDGNTEGVSISSLAEELWNICTAQQRKIDDLESRLADLEAKQE